MNHMARGCSIGRIARKSSSEENVFCWLWQKVFIFEKIEKENLHVHCYGSKNGFDRKNGFFCLHFGTSMTKWNAC